MFTDGRLTMLKRLVMVSMLIGCGGGGEPIEDETVASASRCERLRDHLVELRLATATKLGDEREQHRAALTQALGPQFVDACTTTTTEAQVTCALAAADSQAAADCHAPHDSQLTATAAE